MGELSQQSTQKGLEESNLDLEEESNLKEEGNLKEG